MSTATLLQHFLMYLVVPVWLLAGLAGLVLHQATAVWDVRYANATRRVTPVEQHVHGVLEMTPAIAVAVIAILHWQHFLALFGVGEASFALEFKREPLPTWYLAVVMLAVAICGVVPYAEELLRTARAAAAAGSPPSCGGLAAGSNSWPACGAGDKAGGRLSGR